MSAGTDVPLFHADFQRCADCGEIVVINGRGECLETDEAAYCPRHARFRIDEGEYELRWGEAMRLLNAIREDPTQAIKYSLRESPGSLWVVHREDNVYEQWNYCDDPADRNFRTISESSIVRDIERRSLFGAYVGDPPHLVAIEDAPINAAVSDPSANNKSTTGGCEDV